MDYIKGFISTIVTFIVSILEIDLTEDSLETLPTTVIIALVLGTLFYFSLSQESRYSPLLIRDDITDNKYFRPMKIFLFIASYVSSFTICLFIWSVMY